MRAVMLAAVAALALSGCATVSDAVSDHTGTTLAQRCERYQAELQFAREALTIALPGSPTAEAAVARIATLELLVDLYCIRAEPAAEGIAIETADPSTTGETDDAQ